MIEEKTYKDTREKRQVAAKKNCRLTLDFYEQQKESKIRAEENNCDVLKPI